MTNCQTRDDCNHAHDNVINQVFKKKIDVLSASRQNNLWLRLSRYTQTNRNFVCIIYTYYILREVDQAIYLRPCMHHSHPNSNSLGQFLTQANDSSMLKTIFPFTLIQNIILKKRDKKATILHYSDGSQKKKVEFIFELFM